MDDLLSSYSFELPPELIAQHPAARRDESRLLVLHADGRTEGKRFRDLPSLLAPGDLLVRNNVKVMPARLLGKRRGGGAAELLLTRRGERDGGEAWLCLARPGNRFKPGKEFFFGDGELTATALENDGDGAVWVRFSRTGAEFMATLDRLGRMPLPPYIERPDRTPTAEDAERYQTIYAKEAGAVAAPTAGLHFTPEVDRALAARGVEVAEVTLNVGPGTFRTIKAEFIADHVMDHEWYRIPRGTWDRAAAARARGGRVVAVGTTSARTLEAAARSAAGGNEPALEGWTNLFIRPGHEFRLVDGLVTNFHLPGSSLVVLVSALAGRERTLAAYAGAVRDGYRFYSYGDAMLVWRSGSGAV